MYMRDGCTGPAVPFCSDAFLDHVLKSRVVDKLMKDSIRESVIQSPRIPAFNE